MSRGYCEFEFDLPAALLTSMVRTFDALESAPLAHDFLQNIPEGQGVYQLLLAGHVVYIGKTDSDAGLRKRLERHAWSIQNRENLNIGDVTFRAVRVFVFTAMDLETELIRHYGGSSGTAWNQSGFGSNDPGRNRDKTFVKPNSFDALYPLDIDQPVELGLTGDLPVLRILETLRRALPYTFRFERAASRSTLAHPDLQAATLNALSIGSTCRQILASAVQTLPSGWQATALAGRVILYKEHEEGYPASRVIARS